MERTLDRIDAQILTELQNNARLSNKELAGRVGLAPSSCLERVRRLESSGVIRGYHADVDPRALGISLEALISVRMRQEDQSSTDTFRRELLEHPEVIEVYHLAGVIDFLIHVVVRDVEHLRSLALDRISPRPEVAHMETALIFEYRRGGRLPDFSAD